MYTYVQVYMYSIFFEVFEMTYYDSMPPEDRRLESLADGLIGEYDRDVEFPARREESLVRAGRRMVNMEGVAENAPALPQSARDELLFLLGVTSMPEDVRLCLLFWIDGWTQCEVSATMGICQQRVSQLLRKGLRLCCENLPISFREFSRHSIYHPPNHRRAPRAMRQCVRCGEPYEAGTGYGRCCSLFCSESRRHKM